MYFCIWCNVLVSRIPCSVCVCSDVGERIQTIRDDVTSGGIVIFIASAQEEQHRSHQHRTTSSSTTTTLRAQRGIVERPLHPCRNSSTCQSTEGGNTTKDVQHIHKQARTEVCKSILHFEHYLRVHENGFVANFCI